MIEKGRSPAECGVRRSSRNHLVETTDVNRFGPRLNAYKSIDLQLLHDHGVCSRSICHRDSSNAKLVSPTRSSNLRVAMMKEQSWELRHAEMHLMNVFSCCITGHDKEGMIKRGFRPFGLVGAVGTRWERLSALMGASVEPASSTWLHVRIESVEATHGHASDVMRIDGSPDLCEERFANSR
jgi:hypothetical protein